MTGHQLHSGLVHCAGSWSLGVGPHTYCRVCGHCEEAHCAGYAPVCPALVASGTPVSNHAAAWTPDDAKPDDPYTAQEDAVAAIGEWPRSKQLQAARYLYNLGIRQTDCDPQLIKRAWKKEQA